MTDNDPKPAPRATPPRRDPQGNAGTSGTEGSSAQAPISRDAGARDPGSRGSGKQGWAVGLRKLYDGVVSEPLPDSFEDLLKRLDKEGND